MVLQSVPVLLGLLWLLYLPFVSACVPSSEPLSGKMGALRLDSSDQRGQSPVRMVQSEAARDRRMAGSVVLLPSSGPAAGPHPGLYTDRRQSGPGAGLDQTKVTSPAGSQLVEQQQLTQLCVFMFVALYPNNSCLYLSPLSSSCT